MYRYGYVCVCVSDISRLAIHTFDVHDVLGIIVSTVVRVLLDQTWMNVAGS